MTNKVKKILKGALGSGIGLVVGATAISALAYQGATHAGKRAKQRGQVLSISENTDEDNAWYLKQAPIEWRVSTDDGLTLRASYLASEITSQKAVILAHGIGHSREQMIPYARLFHDWGYHVLMPDARAHGESGGNVIGFGWPERLDYLKWLELMNSELGTDVSIVLFGISMGAATVLATAGERLPDNVKAVVADSGFASVYEMAKYLVRKQSHMPSFPFVQIADRIAQLHTGTRFSQQNVARQLQQTKVPVLLIHGRTDAVVPFSNLAKLVEASGTRTEVYVDDHSPHVMAFSRNGQPYREKLARFLASTVSDD